LLFSLFIFSSRRRHTRSTRDWSSDVCSSDLIVLACLLLTACQGSKKKVIAVVPKGTSHLFWQSVQAGAIAAGRDLGVEVVWNGRSEERRVGKECRCGWWAGA